MASATVLICRFYFYFATADLVVREVELAQYRRMCIAYSGQQQLQHGRAVGIADAGWSKATVGDLDGRDETETGPGKCSTENMCVRLVC